MRRTIIVNKNRFKREKLESYNVDKLKTLYEEPCSEKQKSVKEINLFNNVHFNKTPKRLGGRE